MKKKELNFRDYYTKDEIDYMCMYYWQIPENLPYNLKAIFVEKYENEIDNRVKEIILKGS